MKRIGVVLAVLALAVPVFAGQIEVASSGPIHMGAPSGSARDYSLPAYSNLTNVGQYGYTCTSGATANEVGDDMAMINVPGAILRGVSFTVWNSDGSTALPVHMLNTLDIQLKIYNGVLDPNNVWNYSLAGTFNFDNAAVNLSPGYFTVLTASGLETSGLALSTHIMASLKFTDLQGGSTAAGQILYNPPTIGTSQPYFLKNGAYGWWFGSTGPVANFGWEIIPEPASMLLLGLAGLLIRRR